MSFYLSISIKNVSSTFTIPLSNVSLLLVFFSLLFIADLCRAYFYFLNLFSLTKPKTSHNNALVLPKRMVADVLNEGRTSQTAKRQEGKL